MLLSEYTKLLLPAIEEELKIAVEQAGILEDETLKEMLKYHMGWTGAGSGPQAQGKRIRPLLLLLTTIANQGEWQTALPAAAAVELIHNFSLIHDDIEDKSVLRRGRKTLWTLHQIPLALNAGDSMFSLAFAALGRSSSQLDPQVISQVYHQLSQTCLKLTQGQHLDLSFETQDKITTERYFQMIQGKTAAMLAAATQIGAIIAGKNQAEVEKYRNFGFNLGISFQIQDDILGIWGDEAITGKSAASDLIARKKSLPILYGLGKNGEFSRAWNTEDINPKNAPLLAEILQTEGAYDYAQGQVEHYTRLSLSLFDHERPENSGFTALKALALKLLSRSA
ncbi:MAG: polyprenyl synthetase family protein [Chloroflexota bacterium]